MQPSNCNPNGYHTVKLFCQGRDGHHRFLGLYPRADIERTAREIAKLRRHAICIQYHDMSETYVKPNGWLSAKKERTPRKKKRSRSALHSRVGSRRYPHRARQQRR